MPFTLLGGAQNKKTLAIVKTRLSTDFRRNETPSVSPFFDDLERYSLCAFGLKLSQKCAQEVLFSKAIPFWAIALLETVR
jgi:hypothetical protein